MDISFDDYEVHPAADLFPIMSDDELQELADDIREHGQQSPIELLEGTNQIVDGRNRYLACKLADVEPQFVTVVATDEYDAEDIVVSRNILRRQLSPDGRRELVGKLRSKGKSIREISQITKIPKSTVSDDVSELSAAGRIEEPEYIESLDKKRRPASTKNAKGTSATSKKKNYTSMAEGVAEKINTWLRPDQNITNLIEELIEHRRDISEIAWENLCSVIGLEAQRARRLGERMWDGDVKELVAKSSDDAES